MLLLKKKKKKNERTVDTNAYVEERKKNYRRI